MKMVGKPDAGDPQVRFEEGGGPEGPSLLDVLPCRDTPDALKGRCRDFSRCSAGPPRPTA